ncbi:hypothetical protein RHMOL_Rhmol11G0063900 [Rhododendron molle]|uniref:Uncharacterized protein n=1 Tax=Rhododendron molle TaxID=49168 RepID=A0ACC0LQ82_RHOML|nr:hypothetical protein RHMOL_Rhmol11G0063900 [Rhododendron molle]
MKSFSMLSSYHLNSLASLSLSSRAGSSFIINPDTVAAHTLKTWYIANKEKVEQLCDRFLAKSIIRMVPKPEDKDITPITDVPDTPETVNIFTNNRFLQPL